MSSTTSSQAKSFEHIEGGEAVNGLKRVIYSIKIPPNVLHAIPALLTLLNKFYPGRWSFKVSWQVRSGGQIAIVAELKLGKLKQ